jgi:hypothetical protein
MRKAINFFRSYYDVAKELSDKDRLAFYDAILKKQFENIDTNLTGMANFAYVSQKHSITSQIKGYYDKTKDENFNPKLPPSVGGSLPPSVQVQGKGEGQVQQVKIDFNLFWDLYPKKAGKKVCEPKWNKLTLEQQNKIIATLPSFIKYKPFETYNHPNPETYLNQERWNDEINIIPEEKPYNYEEARLERLRAQKEYNDKMDINNL